MASHRAARFGPIALNCGSQIELSAEESAAVDGDGQLVSLVEPGADAGEVSAQEMPVTPTRSGSTPGRDRSSECASATSLTAW